MIQHTNSDIMSITEGIFVHGCNSRGVMGAGVAALVKKQWPAAYQVYLRKFRSEGGLQLGDVISIGGLEIGRDRTIAPHLTCVSDELPPNLIVVNAITQESLGRDPNRQYVSYDAVTACFAKIKLLAQAAQLPVHFPLIGCGYGKGKWSEIGPRISAALGPDIAHHLWLQSDAVPSSN
jgi:O-acetyl-ADP-ribose deacetylase (regulator of RNase III)